MALSAAPPGAAAHAAARTGHEPIRVFIVDDSSVVRNFVTKTLGAEPGIKVEGTASDGAAAVKQLQGLDVDVVVLDVEMPVLDGLSALPQILKATVRPPKVVMASTLTTRGASISIQALVKGAADYVPKPSSIAGGGAEAFATAIVDRVRVWGAAARKESRPAPRMAAARSVAPAPRPAPVRTTRRRVDVGRARPQALAIGCSTGGPQALLRLFGALKDKSLGPIFVTQHMPPTFTTLFAQQLGRASGRDCHEGIDGEDVRDDVIYLAPGDYHMQVEGRPGALKIRRLQTPPENYCRPAVDPMFRSLAPVYKERLLALVLTGMGQDGCKGARAVTERGGTVLAQDEATSVVWGMPGAVVNGGLATEILPIDALPGRVGQLFGSPA